MRSDHTPERRDLAHRAANAALRLRPEAGEAHFARAHYLRCNLDYDNARAELAFAQRALPNNAQVFYLMGSIDDRQGRSNGGAKLRKSSRARSTQFFYSPAARVDLPVNAPFC